MKSRPKTLLLAAAFAILAARATCAADPVDNPPAWLLGPHPSANVRGFYRETRLLSEQGMKFDDNWTPPGEDKQWTLDCSTVARYLYRKVTGIVLPRKASEIYLNLRAQGKAWDVPPYGGNVAKRRAFLRRNLKPCDLIFGENTCIPKHDPPITHMMIFLGRVKSGKSVLAGCQTGVRIAGVYKGHDGGADIYVYDPTTNIGGYVTPQMVFKLGHLQAIGRPLEADPAKLAADND